MGTDVLKINLDKTLGYYCNIQKDFIILHREHADEDEFKFCVCGVRIKELCHIYNKVKNRNLIVGNECITRFAENPMCERCGYNPATSNTAKLCQECRKPVRGRANLFEVRLKKYKGQSFQEVLNKDPKWCAWVRDEMNPEFDPNFVKWLKRKQELSRIK